MNFRNLYKFIVTHQAENKQYAHPFIVNLKNDEKVIVWFQNTISGVSKDLLFAHISNICVLNSDYEYKIYEVIFDIPCAYSEVGRELLQKYLVELEKVYENYSEEKMNQLIQDMSYKPLFKAYQCVRDYVRTHYTREEE